MNNNYITYKIRKRTALLPKHLDSSNRMSQPEHKIFESLYVTFMSDSLGFNHLSKSLYVKRSKLFVC